MPASINGLGLPTPPMAPPLSPTGADSLSAADSPLFGKMLLKSLGEVNGLQQSAQAAVEKAVSVLPHSSNPQPRNRWAVLLDWWNR